MQYMMNSLLFGRALNSVGRFVVRLTKKLQLIIPVVLLLAISSTQVNAQAAGNEVIKGWSNLEEAEFLFDVYYQVVKCNPVSPAEVHLWAFNEGGNVDAIGFTLVFKDQDGTEVTHTVEKFEISLGQSFKTDCSNDDYPYLKLALPDDIDVQTMTIDITYNK